jgi:hypothetical protein
MKQVLLCLLLIAAVSRMQAQGCSDAGLCSIEVLKPTSGSDIEESPNQLQIGFSAGSADYNIGVFGGHLGYSRQLGSSWSVDTKITFLAQSGNDISVAGLGDVFANLNYMVSQKFTILAGIKIPLMKADRRYNELMLPMDYQSSLGTLDLLAGIKYTTVKWQVTAALQLPLQQNENTFDPDFYPPQSPLVEFQNTNEFHRQADVLLHLSRIIPMSDRITITPGLLGIYHLDEDTFIEYEGIADNPVVYPITGSDGLTLNGTVFVDIKSGADGSFSFNLGFPFVVREARPDGLTRSFVAGAGYSLRF